MIKKFNTPKKIISLQWSNNWEPNIFYEQCQYTILSLLHSQWLDCRTLNESATSVFSHFLPTANVMAWFLSLYMTFTTPQCPKFFSIWGAGRYKPLIPTHYFHPPHKDQSIRVQTIIHKKIISVTTQHFKDCYCYTLSVDATLLLFVYQVSINLKVIVEDKYFGLWISVF